MNQCVHGCLMVLINEKYCSFGVEMCSRYLHFSHNSITNWEMVVSIGCINAMLWTFNSGWIEICIKYSVLILLLALLI